MKQGESGQGVVEYSLILLLVALVFWVAVKNSGVGESLSGIWGDIDKCIASPLSCESKK